MVRFLFLVVSCFAIAGCNDSVQAPSRTFIFNFDLDEPSGLYCVELRDDEQMSIRENLTLPVTQNNVTLDRAFLRNAIVKFEHRGQSINNGAYEEASKPKGLYYWMIHRDEREIWYYIGTYEQYAGLDRNRPHNVGRRVIQL